MINLFGMKQKIKERVQKNTATTTAWEIENLTVLSMMMDDTWGSTWSDQRSLSTYKKQVIT